MENEKLNEMLKSIWDGLTDEQKEKARACRTAEELTALAGKEGIELPDEVLDGIAGGYIYSYYKWGIYGKEKEYDVIEDKTGKVLATHDYSIFAEKDARARGQSDKYINADQLDRLRKTGSIGC